MAIDDPDAHRSKWFEFLSTEMWQIFFSMAWFHFFCNFVIFLLLLGICWCLLRDEVIVFSMFDDFFIMMVVWWCWADPLWMMVMCLHCDAIDLVFLFFPLLTKLMLDEIFLIIFWVLFANEVLANRWDRF